jgi:hypothetical protein
MIAAQYAPRHPYVGARRQPADQRRGIAGWPTIVETWPPAKAGDAARVVVDGARLLGVT